ncbi:hypothetical protein JL721_8881 [Aureococcus anophagefferens]|nr:hypothetical protein JL721_8881 [Aureococcus anophagefferens]
MNALRSSRALLVATRACPDVSFTARNIAVVGSGESVLAIDVDDDGDIDVLAASKNDDTVNWYENDGSQSFTERIITTLADEVRSTYAIDVDGDGDVDALSASLADDTVAWYENDGSQSFTTRVVEAAADAAVSVFAIDVDGDGDVDALSASKQDATVAWYDNDGSESFTERVITTLADGAYPSFTERVITTLAVEAQSVFAIDVDDDGDVDVVSASAGDDTIAWYVNDGVDVVSKNVVSTLADEALGVYAIDVDGDGDVDVLSASANDDTVAWSFTERVVTTLAVKAVSVFAFDVDGDGDVDALSAGEAVSWYENGCEPFEPPPQTTCASVSFLERVVSTLADNVFSVFAADVDGDGDVDVLSAGGYSSESEVAWYENDGSLSFTARLITNLALTPQAAYATDVDGDGDVDALSASADDGRVAWYENDGSQSFTERVVTDSAGYTYTTCLYATDVNDDGSMDVLLARNDDGHVVWYENDGSQSFTGVVSGTMFATRTVYAIDVDGDGDVDALSASYSQDTVAWFENDGSQSFTERVVAPSADGARVVFAIDVDGDGDVDVLSGTQEAGSDDNDDTVAWYENDGSESFTERVIIDTLHDVQSVFAIDVNGDGAVDALSASSGDNTVAYYENVGSLFFLHRVITASASGAWSVFAVDVDDDGDVDAVGVAWGATVAWFENDCETFPPTPRPTINCVSVAFSEHDITVNADGAACTFAIDVDGDGDVDAMSASVNDLTVAWYENDGSQSFAERVITNSSYNITNSAEGAVSVFAIDLDGDGDVDALSASFRDDTVAWYENDGSQSFSERVITNSADGAYSVFAIDVDGNGDVDALASLNDDTVAWYENDGAQSFTERFITNSANGAISVFAIDVDGDGDVDALSAPSRSVITNSADGAYSVYAIDVDGDGDVDALSASKYDDTVAWYENDGSESFTKRVITNSANGAKFVFAIDVDGDGDVDVLSASYLDNTVAWYENDGSQSFTERVITDSADAARSVYAIDVDGDGDVDALSASGRRHGRLVRKRLRHARAHGRADDAPALPPTAARRRRADADPERAADGRADDRRADEQPDGDLRSLGRADDAALLPPGDVNGDKDVDVGYSKLDADGAYVFALRSTCDAVSGCADPEVEFASTSQNLGYASDLGNIVLENLDGDGDYDVVTSWGDSDGFGVTVLLDEGDDVVDAAATDVARVAAVDVDGDADLDVVAASAAGLVWYENDGESIYGYYSYNNNYYYGSNDYGGRRLEDYPIAWKAHVVSEEEASSLLAADLDGDEDIDLLTTLGPDLVFGSFVNDGAGTFANYTCHFCPPGAAYAAAGDYDGDGHNDFVVAFVGDETRVVFFEDLDGDGDLEILVADFGNGQILALEEVCAEAPDPTFDPAARAPTNARAVARAVVAAPVAAADVPADGAGADVVNTGVAPNAPGANSFSVTVPSDAEIASYAMTLSCADDAGVFDAVDFAVSSTPVPSTPPTSSPSVAPSVRPSTAAPSTAAPSGAPSVPPSLAPTSAPPTSASPTTDAPSRCPSYAPSELPTPEPSSPSPSGAPSAAPSPAPSPAPSTAAPSSFPTPDCSGNASLFSYERGPDVESWAGSTTTSYAGLDGTNGAVLRTLDDADTTLVTFLCAPDDVEVCNTVVFDFGDAVPSGDLFFRVTLGNSSIETSFDDEESPVSTYMFCLSHGAIVRAPTAAPTASPAPTTGSPSDAPTPTRPPTIYCHDDAAWYKRDAPSKHCDWVAGSSAGRCEVVGADDRLAHEACRASCGCSAPPSAAPSVLPTASFLEITSVGTEQVCVGNLECPVLWTYRGPDCATASVVVVSSADGAVVSSAAGVDNSGAATAIVPGDAALSDYEMTITACGVTGTATLTVSATPAPTLTPTTLSPSTSAPTLRPTTPRPSSSTPTHRPTPRPTTRAPTSSPPTSAAPSQAPAIAVTIASSLVFDDLAAAFNADASAQEAFRQSLVATVALVESADQVSNVVATSARRRRLDEGAAAEVSYDVTVVVEGASDVDAATADVLATYEADLSDALEDGSYAEALDDAADAEGTDFSFDVDEASSVASVEASEVDKLVAVPDPPVLAAAAFSSSGARLTLTFDAPTDLAGLDAGALFACGDLFDFPGAADASCYWYNATAADATVDAVVPGDAATLRPGLVTRACVPGDRCDCYGYANASEATVTASNPAVPVAVVQGPLLASTCDGFVVSAAQSTGGGGRPLEFAWTAAVDGNASYVLDPANASAVGATPRRSPRSSAGATAVDLRLNVTNFFGESDVADHVVRITDKAVPSCELVGGDHRTFLRSRASASSARVRDGLRRAARRRAARRLRLEPRRLRRQSH